MLIQQRCENDPLNQFVNDFLVGKSNLIGIEIGSYRGESTEIFLKSNAFQKLYCIDPWEPGYDIKDLAASKEIILAEKEFDEKFKNNDIIIKIKQKSSNAFTLFENESIDFIYIDGNHQYEFVKNDLNNFFCKIKNNGIISGHDYHIKCDGWLGVKKAVDEFFKKEPLKIYEDCSWVFIKNN